MRVARFSICGLAVVVRSGSHDDRVLRDVEAHLSSRDLDGAIREMDRAWRSARIDHRALAPVYARLLIREGRNWGTVIGLLSQRPETLATTATQADLALAFERSGQPALAAQVREAAKRLTRKFDGRATFAGREIRGWARIGSNLRRPILIDIHDERGGRARLRADQPLPGERWGFHVNPRQSRLSGDRFEIRAKLPDGAWQSFPDNPLLTSRFVRRCLSELTPNRRIRPALSPPPVSIVIPAYADRERTLACIDAVLRTARDEVSSVIVVDDASPEAELPAALDALALRGDIKLLRNERNLGFSASVNRGIAFADEDDVVILNSDGIVFGNWLARLRAAAYSHSRIGTATPLTDDDSIAGYAGGKTGEDSVSRAEQLDRIACSELAGRTIDLPVGVGFCMYIRRDCWRDTGPFDEATFPAGYGEEADFCMRARARQWRHVLAADVFAHHAGGKSFGARRQALLERSARLLNLRHPGYDAFVQSFAKADPIAPARRALDESRLRHVGAPFVLLVTHALPGGVDRFVADRSRVLRAQGKVPLVLRPRKLDDMSECVVDCAELGLVDLRYRIPAEVSALHNLFGSLRIDAIEIQHFLGLDPGVMAMVRRLGAPIDTFIHDYSWICPRVTLVDGSGSYCGEPAISVCEQCVKRNGSYLPETITVRALRKRSAEWLLSSRRVSAPSADAATRLQRYVNGLAIDVTPHETFIRRSVQARTSFPGKRLRVAVIGAIGHHKGFKVLLDCARDANRRGLDLEFVVIGYSEDDERLTGTGRIAITGRYREDEIAHLLRRESPQVVFLPSVWPETWCYTLSHAIASGLPVAAFDIGAMGERLRMEPCGTLLPLGLSPREINDLLVGLGRATARSDKGIFGSDS